jgi:hypothetical protein
VNTLIQDNSRTSGEQLNPIELLNSLSPSVLTPHAQNMKMNTIFISFILQQLIGLQHDEFPIKIAFDMTVNKAQWQSRKLVAIYLPLPASPPPPPMTSSMWHFTRSSSFDDGAVAVIEGRRKRKENGR